ncbi:hypothetical protein GCM10017566_20430 [Amycolatopsis bartoniae]|uniref:Uncharacterized protein n=1 Tax=Amycolatopsis bartoniae TaxID=941986 RepID=A0A8H9ISL2_9PSEU|nr:hypothetical protein GCM10017566_20430 [Amycolatopsis bartoniae]
MTTLLGPHGPPYAAESRENRMVIMATRIDFGPGETCFACLVPRDQTPVNEEWCYDVYHRPLCGQCARDECIIHEPWGEEFPEVEFLSRDAATLSYLAR